MQDGGVERPASLWGLGRQEAMLGSAARLDRVYNMDVAELMHNGIKIADILADSLSFSRYQLTVDQASGADPKEEIGPPIGSIWIVSKQTYIFYALQNHRQPFNSH